MKTKYLWRRVISVLVALALFVTGIGINSYAASDDVMLGEKGRLTYTNYLTGTNALVNSFKNHSIQKMTIKPKSGGSGLAAFCIAPDVKFPNEQHSYVYKATSSMLARVRNITRVPCIITMVCQRKLMQRESQHSCGAGRYIVRTQTEMVLQYPHLMFLMPHQVLRHCS